jgi:hypothetical protein
MLGDLHPRLRRVGPVERELDDQLWVLTHPDIRRSDRIRRFMMHCIDAIRRNRNLIEGIRGDDMGTILAGDTTPGAAHSPVPLSRAS